MQRTSSGLLVLGHSGSLPDPPSMKANMILRLILCPVALLSIWVPLAQLWRNGEFSACVFVINNWLMVLIVFVNAALWHSQDFDGWWLGVGWCDLLAYVQYAMMTLFCASACAIMRRLSKQVGLSRVSGLSARERRNDLLVQSLILFPVPLLQVLVTVFVSGERYRIMPVNGCTSAYYPNPVFLVIFLIPPPLFSIGACFHTIQTYRRFREVDADSRVTLSSGANTSTSLRRQRARRKLYFMVMCLLVPYTPMIIAFFVFDLLQGWPFQYPVDYHFVHVAGIVPWNSVTLMSYAEVGFISMNLTWVPVVASFISFIFFGTSKEAINMYRRALVNVGLGYCFSRLNEPYDPDRSRLASSSQLNSNVSSTGTQVSTGATDASSAWSRKGSLAPILPPRLRQSSSSGQAARSGSIGDGDGLVQRPEPSAWRAGLRCFVATTWPYAVLSGGRRRQQHANRSPGMEGMELESGQHQASSVSFRDPFRDPFPEAFPPSFPQPFPKPAPRAAMAHAAAPATTRPVFNPGLPWATPPTIQNRAMSSIGRPSTAPAKTTADELTSANNTSSPPGRLRWLFPLAPSSPPTNALTLPPTIYDGTIVPGLASSGTPATAGPAAFQTLVWSGAGRAKQQQQQQRTKTASADRLPAASGGDGGGVRREDGLLVVHETVGLAVAPNTSTHIHAKTNADADNTREAAPDGVRVDRCIVTSKATIE